MDHNHRDAHSPLPPLSYSRLTIPASFESPAKGVANHQLNRVPSARFARLAARATWLAGLLAFLWIASPQAWSAWPFPTGNEVNSSPAIGVDGTIYFGSSDGRLYAVQTNGTPKW